MTCDCRSHNGFLTAKGLIEAAERRAIFREGVDMDTGQLYLDLPVSVSGVRRDETLMIFDEGVIDEQHRRFLNDVRGVV